jgi:hypothetical protein
MNERMSINLNINKKNREKKHIKSINLKKIEKKNKG